jgi:hypothetical protein
MSILNGKVQDSLGVPMIIHPGANPDPLGKVLDELVVKFQAHKRTLWEDRMRLHLKPKPRFIPEWAWRRMVRAVLVQSVEGSRGR